MILHYWGKDSIFCDEKNIFHKSAKYYFEALKNQIIWLYGAMSNLNGLSIYPDFTTKYRKNYPDFMTKYRKNYPDFVFFSKKVLLLQKNIENVSAKCN